MDKKTGFTDPEEKIEDIRSIIDGYKDKGFTSPQEKLDAIPMPDIFSETPMELKKTTENLGWINNIREHLPFIKKHKFQTEVFGVEKVNLDDILMLNIWDRSILTTDAVSRLVFKMTLEQLRKYLPKKTAKGFEYWWLILLMIIGGGAILLIIIFLLPQLSGIKII